MCELIQALKGGGRNAAVTLEVTDRIAVAGENGRGILMGLSSQHDISNDVMGDLKALVCKK